MTYLKRILSNTHYRKSTSISPAIVTGLCGITLSFIVAMVSIQAAVIPLALFILICLLAPFFPRLGFYLPVISRGHSGKKVISITFDDGPDPETTFPLLQLLATYDVKVTFFVVGEKAFQYGEIIKEIIKRGHDIGNHSYSHDPLLMLRFSKKLCEEIEKTQMILSKFNIVPFAFRPPAGIMNPKLGNILSQLGMYCVTFSCRGFDGGNRYIRGLAETILKKVKPDDIIVLHDVKPKRDTSVDVWLKEIELILSGIKEKKLCVVSLAELIGVPVMKFEHRDTVQ